MRLEILLPTCFRATGSANNGTQDDAHCFDSFAPAADFRLDIFFGDNFTGTVGNSLFSSRSVAHVRLSPHTTAISAYAFSSNFLTRVIIPSSVTTIGTGAFEENRLLKVLIFERPSAALVTISASAFATTLVLTTIFFPTEVGIDVSQNHATFRDSGCPNSTFAGQDLGDSHLYNCNLFLSADDYDIVIKTPIGPVSPLSLATLNTRMARTTIRLQTTPSFMATL